MNDILSAIEVVGSGRRSETARLCLRAKIGFIAPFGYVEPKLWNANLSETGIAINCQTTLLSQDLIDSIWTIQLYLDPEQPTVYLSLASQLVRVSESGWVAFQFVCIKDEDCAVIGDLIQNYADKASIEDPLDLVCTIKV